MRPVTAAQAKPEREHNQGEVQVCGGCRWFSRSLACLKCEMPDDEVWPDTDATDCEAWEQGNYRNAGYDDGNEPAPF